MASEKMIKYINRYNNDHYERISLFVPKGEKEAIRARATSLQQSMNEYINTLILADLSRKESAYM